MARRALLLCALAALTQHGAADEATDVCVVGGGPAGIGAALALVAKGKRVALLERDAVAGGQTKPEYRDAASGFRLHMGAIVITPPDYPTVMEYARRTGVGVEARCGAAAVFESY